MQGLAGIAFGIQGQVRTGNQSPSQHDALAFAAGQQAGVLVAVNPAVLDWTLQAKNASMYNTPPTYSIYLAGLVFQWLKQQGGLAALAEDLHDFDIGAGAGPGSAVWNSRSRRPILRTRFRGSGWVNRSAGRGCSSTNETTAFSARIFSGTTPRR